MHIVPALIACLILSAHFLRAGNLFGFLAVLAITALALLARREWSLMLMQGMLFASPVLWIVLVLMTAMERMADGRPYLRACAIFVAVALFSLWSAALLSKPKARERFGR